MPGALDRFVTAQAGGVYEGALAELRRGRKTGHWIWYVFPQIAGLGMSAMSQAYAIRDLDEARDYLAHPLLGPRLIAAAEAVLAHAGRHTAEAMLGGIDAIKLRSSATLFEAAGDDAVFARILDAFYAGERDPATLARLC
jgi:uncharacterized protein (DUF1810 family)